MDIAPLQGKTATLKVDKLPEDSAGLKAIDQSDEIKNVGNSLPREAAAAVPFLARDAAGTTTRTGWSSTRASITCSSSTIPTAGAGATCTGATRSARTWFIGRSCPIALYPDEHGTDVFRLGRGGLEQHRRLPDGRREGARLHFHRGRQTLHRRASPTATTAAAPGRNMQNNPVAAAHHRRQSRSRR